MKYLRVAMSVAVIFALLSVGVSAASPGAIAFVGFNADGTDGFAFVLLSGANAGSVVYFSDKEWDGSSFNTGEGIGSWTSPVGGLPAGTVVTVSGLTSAPLTASAGSFLMESGSMDLSGSGEAIYAYQGTDANTPSMFLAVISNGTLANTGASLANTGLSEGTTAIVFPTSRDILVYNGSLSFANEAAAHTAIGNTSNWIYQSGSGDQSGDATPPDFPDDVPTSFTISAPTAITLRGLTASSGGTTLPVMGLALAGLMVGVVVVRRK